eukprot:gene30142-35121_t
MSSAASLYAWYMYSPEMVAKQYNYINHVPDGLNSCVTFVMDTMSKYNPMTSTFNDELL